MQTNITEQTSMCTQEQAITILGEIYNTCRSIFDCDIAEAYLYGSYARGDFTKESDIDILLTVKADRTAIYEHRYLIASLSSDLSLKHNVTISIIVKPHDEFVLYSDTLPFYTNILKEGIKYKADDAI